MNNLMTIVIVASLTVGGASLFVTPSYAQLPGLPSLPGLTGLGSGLSSLQTNLGTSLSQGQVSISKLPSQVDSGLSGLQTIGQTLSELSGTTGSPTGFPGQVGSVLSRTLSAIGGSEGPQSIASSLSGPTTQLGTTLSAARLTTQERLAGISLPQLPSIPQLPGSTPTG